MKQTITLEINFEHNPALTKDELSGLGEGLIDHIYRTFNDDNSILPEYKIEVIP